MICYNLIWSCFSFTGCQMVGSYAAFLLSPLTLVMHMCYYVKIFNCCMFMWSNATLSIINLFNIHVCSFLHSVHISSSHFSCYQLLKSLFALSLLLYTQVFKLMYMFLLNKLNWIELKWLFRVRHLNLHDEFAFLMMIYDLSSQLMWKR